MKILEVTQMWPSEEHPDLGSFLVPLTRELGALGHEVEVASISRRGGSPTEYLTLVRRARAAAKRFGPDVIFAHFLFPAGAAGALAARKAKAPLVTMAHGQDVANLGRIPGVTAATRWSGLLSLGWSFWRNPARMGPTPTRRVSFRHQPLSVPLIPKQPSS